MITTTPTPAQPDVTIQDEGSIVLLALHTRAAQDWARDHVDLETGYQPYFPGKLIVEPRYAADLLQGMTAAGLSIA